MSRYATIFVSMLYASEHQYCLILDIWDRGKLDKPSLSNSVVAVIM